jgi:hydrogenase maturation protein HypF
MTLASAPALARSKPAEDPRGAEIRVRGRVQGVGFRPTVWRHATELGLDGEVLNDPDGVLIRISGPAAALEAFVERIRTEPPPLARIDELTVSPFAGVLGPGFRIAETVGEGARTQITPDAAVCPACAGETLGGGGRRAGYAFTNCTHCGPRLSIVRSIPYDRARTTMAGFPLCACCRAEFGDPADRRFHAQAIACPACGPAVRLVRLDGAPLETDLAALEPIAAARALIGRGEIVAIKGLGGYQLACDAADADAVLRLRRRKHRDAKPFALMARDRAVIGRYAALTPEAERELSSPAAPIVLLEATGPARLPEAVAPGVATLGFMLPTTPLHLLLLDGLDRPLVMTSGNDSDAPQVTDDLDAGARLGAIARHALVHDRPIANRVDDSVVRVVSGRVRVLRRARGYAPAPVRLPDGFAEAPQVLAMGGELKATFCLIKDGEAILSQHQGDLGHAAAWDDYVRNLDLYARLFDHSPAALAADLHPDYRASRHARARADAHGLPLVEVQHHHAHLAACLAENGRPLDAAPVLGLVLDGLGFGEDGTIWGGEVLLGDYRSVRRLASLKPVAMPGADRAVREPWRNLYAHLQAAFAWGVAAREFARLPAIARLRSKPLSALDGMIARGINAPLASSCGRLFDAVAAALELCPERQAFEGQAAMQLEALAGAATLADTDAGYAFGITDIAGQPLHIDPAPMWASLLADLAAEAPAAVIAARFHRGFAAALAGLARRFADGCTEVVALSGGCFQNRLLFEDVEQRLSAAGLQVLAHAEVPANDGGLALGQAAVAAARLLGQEA